MGKFRSIGSQARQVAIAMFKSGEIRSLATSRNYEQSFRQFGAWLKSQLSKNNAPQLSRATEKICTKSVQERSSSMLRSNPTLSPQQTAILTAIDSESALRAYLGANTPFQDQAFSLVRKIARVLQSARQIDK